MEIDSSTGMPEVPRRVVASFPTYEEAQAAVDRLADEQFPVEHLAIVGSDLRLVEQVTGRLDYGRAAAMGALAGAPVGAFLGLLSSLFVSGAGSVLALILYWLIGGAVAGAVAGMLAHAQNRGRRDFSSVSRMEAGRYDLMATDDVSHEVLSRLSRNGNTPHWPSNARH